MTKINTCGDKYHDILKSASLIRLYSEYGHQSLPVQGSLTSLFNYIYDGDKEMLAIRAKIDFCPFCGEELYPQPISDNTDNDKN
jgi:hypothetical protein